MTRDQLEHAIRAAFALRYAASEGSEVTPRELAARSGFQVGFKGDGLGLIGKGHTSFDSPWTVFRCVRDTPLIMPLQSLRQIGCDAGIMSAGMGLAFQNVNVVKIGWHAKPLCPP